MNLKFIPTRSSISYDVCSTSNGVPSKIFWYISDSSSESFRPRAYNVKSLISLFSSTTKTTSLYLVGQEPATKSYICLFISSLSNISEKTSVDTNADCISPIDMPSSSKTVLGFTWTISSVSSL